MIYETGTIKTTAGQTKITGVGTKWKDNLAGISEGCTITYLINNTVYMNTVLSINSDTEINLTYPAQATSANAKYQIVTVIIDSMSDGARKMLANQLYVQYFLRNMDAWMTQDGVVEVKTPTGEVVKLESIRALKKLIDGKFDKAPALSVTNNDVLWKGQHAFTQIGIGDAGMAGKRAWISLSGMSMNPTGNGFYTITWPEKTGTLMQVGDFGVGTKGAPPFLGTVEDFSNREIGVYIASDSATSGLKALLPSGIFHGSVILTRYNAGNTNCTALLMKNYGSDWLHMIRKGAADSPLESCVVWHSKNTTKDANGNLKAASPIVKVFADHIELNDESEGVKLKKLHAGIYQLKNVLGMHSDASWGGINGGITIPSGINQLPLVYVDYDVLVAGEQHPFNGELVTADEHGDIVIYTSYRKHFDLPQNVQYARLKTYPEFTKSVNDEQVELENGEPVDIPNGHWIDVRVNMPSNSIYNQKQAAAEAHAKEGAERVAREEAERAEQEEDQLI